MVVAAAVAVTLSAVTLTAVGMVVDMGDVEDEGMGKETSMDSVESREAWVWSFPPFLRTISAMRRLRGVSGRIRGGFSGGIGRMVL